MKHSKRSPGFSLILSLTVMAGIVMLLVTVSAFITVESRTVMNQQLATRARLNGLVSMRLALAHLQQEAGPDRRATARADITQPGVSAGNLRNPMWTGVWRSDLPDLPPAWLVSGRGDQPSGTQSVSLFQTGAAPDYHLGYWAPWQSGYAAPAQQLVTLVGRGSALEADGSTPNGLVSLPKIALPDDSIHGQYAYWVGDEGVKARVNLRDTRSTDPANVDQLISVRSPVTHGLLKDLPNQTQLEQLNRLSDFSLTALNNPASGSTLDVRRYFHDVSLTSAGVLADSLNGGLKRDLSVAFELSDDQFAKTEFGQGAPGPYPAAGTMTEKGSERMTMNVLEVFNADNTNTTYQGTPIFSRTVADGQLRGPTWWALRDYHRLYKELGWSGPATGDRATSTPSLRARAPWPNADASRPGYVAVPKEQLPILPASGSATGNDLRRRIHTFSDVYNGDLPPSVNPNAQDQVNGQSAGKRTIIPRPLRATATPYVQRVSLAFSVNKMQWFVWKSIRIGKNVMWYQEEWVDIRVNVTPIVVLHNPYNVRMTLQSNDIYDLSRSRWHENPNNAKDTANKPYKKPYAIALGFSELKDWKFCFKQYTAGSPTPSVGYASLPEFFKMQSGTSDPSTPETPYRLPPYESDEEDTFRLYLTKDGEPDITLEPGEFRVFSCPPVANDWSKSVVLENTYDTRGGFRDNNFDWSLTGQQVLNDFDINSPIAFEIIPGGNMRMRTAIVCNPNDQLYMDRKKEKTLSEINGDKEDFLRLSSEVNEIVFTGINGPSGTENPSQYPSVGDKFFASWRHVRDKYPRPNSQADGRIPYPTPTSPPLEPDLVTVIDIYAKAADTSVTGAPFSLFTHSNPLAPTQRGSASGRIGNGANKGAIGTSPSYQLAIRSGTWANVIANSDMGRLAYGGNSIGAAGTQKAVVTEVPLFQPMSLAQYAHANFGVRDQQPLLSIGNSFASPYIDATRAVQDNGASWTDYDQTYLLNASLWDGFFLSGLAPWMNTGLTPVAAGKQPTPPNLDAVPTATTDANEKKSLTQVIDDFVNKGTPLDNPRFSLERSNLDPASTAKALADYRRSAAVLLNKGAFNVNSTSVTAWQTFLGSAKKFAIADKSAAYPADSSNARFPRVLAKGTTDVAASNFNDPSNWSGFANLTDAQIASLAKAIVDENKARFALQARTERDLAKAPGPRLFAGLTKPATPYLALSEFINRFLNNETWANRCGALQAAILRADQTYNSGLSDRLFTNAVDRKLTEASLKTATAGHFPNPENIEVIAQNGTSRTHTAMGAPGNLLQSDLLQSLGSALASRSDTFSIRCYGEAAQPSGEIGSAWMEVVVQRVPDFVDPANAPETGNSAPKPFKPAASAATDATVSTGLTAVNNVLGRRFKIISMRWLKADEI